MTAPPLLLALTILAVTYILVAVDRLDRSIIALLGGSAMVLTGVLTQSQALAGIDFNTLGMLIGTMVLVTITRRTGMFEYCAIRAAQAVGASPAGLLASVTLVTALLSALLNNVTVVLLVTPITLALVRRLGVAPFPFLIGLVMASNFGGTATLIGDPPNMLIGSSAPLSFNDFLVHLAPVVVVVMAIELGLLHALYGRRMAATPEARAAVRAMRADETIVDATLLRYALAVFALVLAGFLTAGLTGLEAGTVALSGAALLLLLESFRYERPVRFLRIAETYAEVDWITIFFFVGLFIVVRGIEVTGGLHWLADRIDGATGGRLGVAVVLVLGIAALLSALIDNIPFVAAMLPVIHAMAPRFGGDAAILPLWVALSLGACLGGNATLVGASANLTVAGIARREGIPFGVAPYARAALPFTLLALAVALAWLWLRYL